MNKLSTTKKILSFISICTALVICFQNCSSFEALKSNDSSTGGQQVVIQPGVEFFDSFEYVVDRNGTNYTGTANPFITSGGWAYVKSEQFDEEGGSGYLYTTTRIPGYNGTFPGVNSQRVLGMEALPRSLFDPTNPNGIPQTDFYLQFGQVEGDDPSPRGELPGNAWIQFWFYTNYYDDPQNQEDQMSMFDGGFKFIYPCSTFYPCIEPNLSWLLVGKNYNPNPDIDPVPTSSISFQVNGTGANNSAADPANAWKLGNNLSNDPIPPNQWTLIKMHIDTSTPSARYEMWIRPRNSQFAKVAEWIDGQTSNFQWDFTAANVGGHRGFRMPTTFGHTERELLDRTHDSWMYLDDFVITDSEAELPIYP